MSTIYTGWINNKVLLNSTGNYIQHPVINHNGKEYEKQCICIMIESQRDGMGREEGGGFRMGNTCIPAADSF